MQTATEIVTVTPAIAADWLKMNTRNRPMSENSYRVYADAMKRGEWKLNGETIKFASDGVLLDGQTRLRAVITAGVPITFEVRRGLSADVFDTLDSGRKRAAPDVLAISGEKNVNVLSAMLRTILVQKLKHQRISNALYKECLAKNPGVRFWASKFATSNAKKFMPSAFGGLCHIAAEKYGVGPIELFFDRVSSGVGLEPSDPAYVLREKFIERARGQRFANDLQIAYCIKAINAYTQGKKIGILRMFANEAMPEII